MKAISGAMQAHLASGATTLCWCWRLTRKDGQRQGFTDHDRDLVFDATTYEASAGFTASEITDSLGLSVDNLDVSGALSSTSLRDDDLAAGRYDDATIEIFRVNWQDTAQRVLMRYGSLGEVRRSGSSFSAEVRGLAHYLQQPKGRLYQYTCDADLGDARCGVNAAASAYRGAASLSLVISERKFKVSGVAAFSNGFFTRGLAAFTSGASNGLKFEVKAHAKRGSEVTIELWSEAQGPLAAGDGLLLTAGCDKRIETCAGRFANAVNFRGFPDMPGNDFVTRVARRRK